MRTSTSLLAAAAALTLAVPASAAAHYAGQNADGTAPLFDTKFSLAPGDVNGSWDTYVRVGGQTRLVTDGTGRKVPDARAVSADGTIAFFDTESPLVPADGDSESDVYVRRPSGVDLAVPQAKGPVKFKSMTADGARAFLRTAEPLAPADTDTKEDIYELKTATGEVVLRTDGTTTDVTFERTSPNGDVVYFSTPQSLLPGDTDNAIDVYTNGPAGLKEATPGDGAYAAHFRGLGTANGRVLFLSAQQLAPGDDDDAQDLYASIGGGSVDLLTPSPNPKSAQRPVTLLAYARDDAARVVFSTEESLLPADGDATEDIYAREGQSTTLLTPGTAQPVTFADASDDAETILFSTAEPLSGTDKDTKIDMYRATDSQLHHIAQTSALHDQYSGFLNGSGTLWAFETAEALADDDMDALVDVYVRAPFGLISASTPKGGSGGAAAHASPQGFLAGNELLFTTTQRLLPEDRNDVTDVYAFKGTELTLVSVDESAPDTQIDAPARVEEGAVTATLTATEQATFECRVDGAPWGPCSSPWEAAGARAPGMHVLEARAVDVAGNVDPTPATSTLQYGGVSIERPYNPEEEKKQAGEVKPPADVEAPGLSKARVRVRKRVPTLTYSLTERATVRVAVQRKVGRKWKALRTVTLRGAAGANRAKLATLPRRGTFRVVLTATDAAGNASARKTVRMSGR